MRPSPILPTSSVRSATRWEEIPLMSHPLVMTPHSEERRQAAGNWEYIWRSSGQRQKWLEQFDAAEASAREALDQLPIWK